MKAVILAAGRSSRFWPLNEKHKALFPIMGKPIIFYTLKSLEKLGLKEAFIVQNSKEEVEKAIAPFRFKMKLRYVIQKKPLGMGNALWQVRPFLRNPFLLLNAERVDTAEIIKKEDLTKDNLLFGEKTKNPALFGIAKLKRKRVLEIVEKPKQGKEPSNIRILGLYLLEPKFFHYYQKVKRSQYDFEGALSLYLKNEDVKLKIVRKPENETPALKYPWHLLSLKNYLFDRFLKRRVSQSVIVSKKAIIEGKVFIGRGVKIFEGVVIKGPVYIGENTVIGNNSIVRDYTDLEDNVLIGAFSEVARSIFAKDSHCHSGYFGDSIIGRGTRIGAGVITANLRLDRKTIKTVIKGKKVDTRLKRLGAIIGENAKIGIHASLMPGTLIAPNSFILPNSLVKGVLGKK